MADSRSLIFIHRSFLETIPTLKRKQRMLMIAHASRSQVLSIVEVVVNILADNIEIDRDIYNYLNRKRKLLREIAEKQPWQNRRKLLLVLGRGVTVILKGVLPKLFKDEI